MDDIKKFLPGGPNFAPLASFGTAVQYVAGILLAVATLLALVAFFLNLVKWVASFVGNNPNATSVHGKRLGMSLGILLVLGALWTALINFVVTVGNQVA